jgi:Tol biopolymer transport system component
MSACTAHPISSFKAAQKKALGTWHTGVHVFPVHGEAGLHSIHSYFNTCPESPDGKWIVFYASRTADGEEGELRLRERATGKEKVLARNIHTEDAHRAACQQWCNGGKTVVFHDFRAGRWLVAAIEVESGRETVLVRDRQVGFGATVSPWIPVYGCHWNPGPHGDLELVHVETGEIRTVVTVGQVAQEFPEWIRKEFGDRKLSIFFPVMSPDGKRVMFKMASGKGQADFKHPAASHREGKIVYDLESSRFVRLFETWGHPSWHPDSKHILDKGNILTEAQTGESTALLPDGPSDHASFNPSGDLFVTDGKILIKDHPGRPAEWGIFVADPTSHEYVIVHRCLNGRGAQSWRKNHPHPAFSADGSRIYFNVNEGEWTQLFVAETQEPPPQ